MSSSFVSLAARIRDAVETVAATDPNPADPFRGFYITDDAARSMAGEAAGTELDARLHEASMRLGLAPLDAAILGVCAAPHVHPRYGRLFAYLQDDVTRKLATPRLVARLLSEGALTEGDVLERLAREAPLRRTGALRLLDADAPVPLAERPLDLADALAGFLLGAALHERSRGRLLRRVDVPVYDVGRAGTAAELAIVLDHPSELPVLVAGPDAAALLARTLGRPLVLLDVADLVDDRMVRDALLTAALEGATVAVDGLESLAPGGRRAALAALDALEARRLLLATDRGAVVALEDRPAHVVEVPLPTFAEREVAWAALSGADRVRDTAAKFRLSVGRIVEAAEVARLAARRRGADVPSPADLDLGARRASSTRLEELAARLDAAFHWSDLVLPERQLELLRSISTFLRHRDHVLSGWGYDSVVGASQGLKALFAGESGTGKTMAAQVMATELGLDLFRIDLATAVSKYIGETEKNLDRIFDAAGGSNAILFFDEADALFGKRAEVKDAHDRYANIEVAYLLQRMESYAGAVILATNFRQNIDVAFLRRLDFLVDFPFPEADDRERIWRLVLPAAAPTTADVDVRFLAEQFRLAGGSIRNASLAGAFLAAEDGAPISMRHLVKGVALEYGKLGRLTLESDFGQFHEGIQPRRTVS